MNLSVGTTTFVVKITKLPVFLLMSMVLVLQGCGGGDGGGNTAPVAAADAIIVDEGGTVAALTGGVTSVLANDTDADGNTLTAVLVSNPANGSLTLNSNGSFSYTHNGSETTADSFTYRANDGIDNSNTVTVSITVNPINDAPIAAADSIIVAEGGTATTLDNGSSTVLNNDSDAEGDAMEVTLISGTSNGALTLNANGTFSYTHNGGETTTDSFTYQLTDAVLDSNIVTVSITVTPVDDPAALSDDGNSITEDAVPNTVGGNVLSNDTDVDSPLVVTNAGTLSGTYGSLLLNADGSYTYTLDNGNTAVNALNSGGTLSDTFVYNANGQSANLVITINGADDATVLNGDGNSITEDAVPNTVSGNVLSNDVDPDTALTVTNAGTLSGTYGSLLLNADGSYTYTLDNGNAAVNALNSGGTLSDTFVYNANGQSAGLTITINGADDATVLNGDGNSITEDAVPNTVSGNVLSNDVDPDTALTVTNAGTLSGTYGSLLLNADGSYTYTLDNGNAAVNALNSGDTLTDTFAYNANGQSANLEITINGNTDAASISMSGVWMGPAVVTSDPGACSAGLGSIDNNAITITQTGSTLTAKVSNGASLTGTINTSTGDFSFPLVSNTGVLSGVRPDLTQPLNDTAKSTGV
ncbi:MAG: Ig-like domain-containing protein, partial [Gammaproteobacteria bacterium]|nr:Ig-like domain-containing protein [Gammaproteobacteria bacterium]